MLDDLLILLGVKKELNKNSIMVSQAEGTSGAPWQDSEGWSKVTKCVAWIEKVALEHTNTCTRRFAAKSCKSMR